MQQEREQPKERRRENKRLLITRKSRCVNDKEGGQEGSEKGKAKANLHSYENGICTTKLNLPWNRGGKIRRGE